MKYVYFYPTTSLATSLVKINYACMKFITTNIFRANTEYEILSKK